MKLLRVHIIAAESCGGLLDGLDLRLRGPGADVRSFQPFCLIGPNGAGKSQLLQVIAEIFQLVYLACPAAKEPGEPSPGLQFEVEYLIQPSGSRDPAVRVRVARVAGDGHKPRTAVQRWSDADREWEDCDLADGATVEYLPSKIVGYTSGDNETLSMPFMISRAAYAQNVGEEALKGSGPGGGVPDSHLALVDYATNLEVLVANLLLGTDMQAHAILADSYLQGLHSFRCVAQFAHSAAPNSTQHSPRARGRVNRKKIQLTEELESYLDRLQRCSTCWDYDEKAERYTFDFRVGPATQVAFATFWENSLALYAAFHKLAMLNALAIPRATRQRFKRQTSQRSFASRLPEPQDEDKVFRFELVRFVGQGAARFVDYASLSDGEHQLAQLLGIFCMVSSPNVLFLLDEPESHFNPQWRVEMLSKLLAIPTSNGTRSEGGLAAQQECLLTTHAPFVPSDMPRQQVLIFAKEGGKASVRRPDAETYGATFDAILDECFGVRPSMSQRSRDEIHTLMSSSDAAEVRQGLGRLADSVEKVFLADHLRQLVSGNQG